MALRPCAPTLRIDCPGFEFRWFPRLQWIDLLFKSVSTDLRGPRKERSKREIRNSVVWVFRFIAFLCPCGLVLVSGSTGRPEENTVKKTKNKNKKNPKKHYMSSCSLKYEIVALQFLVSLKYFCWFLLGTPVSTSLEFKDLYGYN